MGVFTFNYKNFPSFDLDNNLSNSIKKQEQLQINPGSGERGFFTLGKKKGGGGGKQAKEEGVGEKRGTKLKRKEIH